MATLDKTTNRSDGDQKPAAPSISLPKGGGAIRGMGEKFAANPVTGTGSMTVPIATSPGRSGFGPQLGLSYDSGAGNGPFGFGWSLSLPSITRKTDKGLPKYQDAEESDVFILSGAEDLVPVLVEVNGQWQPETLPPRTLDGEELPSAAATDRASRACSPASSAGPTSATGGTFWRSISDDNITTLYGKTAESRIADPADPTRIFSWLICQSYDDKGNAIVYDVRGRKLGRRGLRAGPREKPHALEPLSESLLETHPLRQPPAQSRCRVERHRSVAPARCYVDVRSGLRLRRSRLGDAAPGRTRQAVGSCATIRFHRTVPASKYAPTACASAS